MNILLISQCSKRALTETRRILDQFAERRGERTWQTAITQAGLDTLYKMLRKSARKNTAVACHWIRGKDHSELLWVVGDARQFNERGATPTNITGRNILRAADENDWHTAEEIRLFSALAALFHDFGKANTFFQRKLKKGAVIADPYRHEWVSLRLFQAFVGNDTDEQWLQRLACADESATQLCLQRLQCDGPEKPKSPFKHLPPLAQAIGWLILSHHRLPSPQGKPGDIEVKLNRLKLYPQGIRSDWCGERSDADAEARKACWSMVNNILPFNSCSWCEHAAKIAGKLLQRTGLLRQTWSDNAYVMHLSRMALMLADHYYSGQPEHAYYGDKKFPLYANTEKIGNKTTLKQRLDEHLIGVETHARRITHSLMRLDDSLPRIARHKGFRQRSKNRHYAWQDKAFDLAEGLQQKSAAQGFFGVNMASTGCGKTLANGRILYALADPQKGARFTIALGLRTLTLQTGEAYRRHLHLSEEDLAVMVGGGAVKELHRLNAEQAQNVSGSESAEALTPVGQYVHYEGSMEDGPLQHWLAASPQAARLVNAPVLTCTIDHLMPATEALRSNHRIPPMLRLMTSDLVLDEPDDFSLEDLPALTRLVNWAGLLGSRVLLSSATLPPDLIQGLFDAYRSGRRHYQNNRGIPGQPLSVCCAWFDEFNRDHSDCTDTADFIRAHEAFVQQRVNKLRQQPEGRRRAEIRPIGASASATAAERYQQMAEQLRQQVLELHQTHRLYDKQSDKHLSIGLIRMANIDPLVEVARVMCASGLAAQARLHLCVYHARHPLLIRSAIEQKLDQVLSRHDQDVWFARPDIRQLLDQHDEPDQILLVLATPVAEVGRDHDYDWAIVEPSSMRSIIQLAGRIRRHRSEPVSAANLYLLNTNLKALRDGPDKPAYCRPGVESEATRLNSHDLSALLSVEQLATIDSRARIQKRESPDPRNNLADMEHLALQQMMVNHAENNKIPACYWWQSQAPLTGILQRKQPFRYDDQGGSKRYWLLADDDQQLFGRWDEWGHWIDCAYQKTELPLVFAGDVSPWGATDWWQTTEVLAERLQQETGDITRRFSWVDLPQWQAEKGWHYHPLLGFSSKK